MREIKLKSGMKFNVSEECIPYIAQGLIAFIDSTNNTWLIPIAEMEYYYRNYPDESLLNHKLEG
jgi:hypothetical protein